MRFFAVKAILSAAVWAANVLTAAGQVCQVTDGRGGFGSAVCVRHTQSNAAYFLTAGHVPAGGQTVKVAPDGEWHSARVLFAVDGAPGRDIGLLECTTWTPRTAYRYSATSPQVGDTVTFAGFPSARALQQTKATIVAHRRGYMLLSRPCVGGESGGPVLDAEGRVVGILTHADGQYAYATNAETIVSTWDRWSRGETLTASSIGVSVAFGSVGLQAGVGGYCTPWGCPPGYSAPRAPLPRPQDPGYPGLSEPSSPLHQPPLSADLDGKLELIVEQIGKLHARIDTVQAQPGPPGKDGRPGRDGQDGPPGPPGSPGRDADVSELLRLQDEIDRLRAEREKIMIPVHIVDDAGQVVSRQEFKLGEPLRLRMRPEPK